MNLLFNTTNGDDVDTVSGAGSVPRTVGAVVSSGNCDDLATLRDPAGDDGRH